MIRAVGNKKLDLSKDEEAYMIKLKETQMVLYIKHLLTIS